MALTINGPGQPGAGQMQGAPVAAQPQQAVAGGASGFLKTGQQAVAARAQEQQEFDNRKNQVFRFRLQPGEQRQITFLDGDLDENGFFKTPFVNEHTVFYSGKWHNIVCVADEENGVCPLCEVANKENKISFASLVGLFTVLDWNGYVDKDGKTHAPVIREFVAKSGTVDQLMVLAEQYQGLGGCTMLAVRGSGDKTPRVGDQFIIQQKSSVQDIAATYNAYIEGGIHIIDYAKSLDYYSGSQLRSMGFGAASPHIAVQGQGAPIVPGMPPAPAAMTAPLAPAQMAPQAAPQMPMAPQQMAPPPIAPQMAPVAQPMQQAPVQQAPVPQQQPLAPQQPMAPQPGQPGAVMAPVAPVAPVAAPTAPIGGQSPVMSLPEQQVLQPAGQMYPDAAAQPMQQAPQQMAPLAPMSPAGQAVGGINLDNEL